MNLSHNEDVFYSSLFSIFFLSILTPYLMDNVIKIERKNLLKDSRNIAELV